ncbi:unnamed protein product [Chrysoparadoxa australica]
MCPVNEPRARRFLKRWACERIYGAMSKIAHSYMATGFGRWKQAWEAERRQLKMKAYLRYQGASKINYVLNEIYLSRLASGWSRWWELLVQLKAEERLDLETHYACVLQRAYRGHAARSHAKRLARVVQETRRQKAATIITKYARGKATRLRIGKLRQEMLEDNAARLLTRVARGHNGRKIAREKCREKAREFVAKAIQNLYRGREGRKTFLIMLRISKENHAAAKLQSLWRGRKGRNAAHEWLMGLKRDASAVKIQAMCRVWLAKRYVARYRIEAKARRQIEEKAAIEIQRVYRGRRVRLLHGVQLQIRRALNRKREAAAIIMQTMARGYISRQLVTKLFMARSLARMADARQWQETWGEDEEKWFYLNQDTGEAIWEPPKTGYAKADGNLVLVTGEVVPDPLANMTEEERTEALASTMCTECETKRACRHCEQCGDKYCTACFNRTHARAQRALHTWTRCGPMECEECEKAAATKWCTSCDDPFCAACWNIIHAKGKRATHSYCSISPDGKVSLKATAPDGGDVGSSYSAGPGLAAEQVDATFTAPVEESYEHSTAAPDAAEVDQSSLEWQAVSAPQLPQ